MTAAARLGGMRTVLMVLFDQVQSLDVTGPLEVFTGANAWQASRGDDPPTTSAPPASAAARCGRPAACASLPDGDLRDAAAGPLPGPADRARGRGIPAGRPGAGRLAAGARRPGRAPGLGVHRRLPARRGRPARRAPGDDPLGLLRRAGRQVPGGQRRAGPDLRQGRARRHLGRASPPGSTSRWPWSRTTSAGRRPSTSPGTWWCSCAARATRPSSAPSSPAAGQPGAAA